jgi:hypothetical protein
MQLEDCAVGKRLFVGDGSPSALGKGDDEVRGSAYIEGPIQSGNSRSYGSIDATLMLAPLKNDDCDTPENTLYVKGQTTHEGDYTQTGDYNHTGDVTHEGDSDHRGDFNIEGCFTVVSPPGCDSQFSGNLVTTGYLDVGSTGQFGGNVTASEFTAGGITLTSRKAFDIPHPTKEGWRLRHICPEGPTADVYVRGRVTNKNRIELPEYWLGLVDPRTITVSLTPIGAHQDVVIKRISENTVHLQSKGGMPIDCFYHIYGERRDGEKLIVEYKGENPEAYPGDNSQYSVAGYHYDTRG